MTDTAAADDIELFHAPNTRSTGVRVLLAELGAPHALRVVNLRAGEQREAAYRAVNPMGKVPALRHRGMLVTEQPAVYIYLADLFPEAGLAPAATDPQRGPYLSRMVFASSCLEPAVVDRALKREPGMRGMSPYGDFDAVLAEMIAAVTPGPWILGERFSAADVLWGMGLGWTIGFGLVPPEPALADYVARFRARPSYAEVAADDARLAAAQEATNPTL